MDVDHRIRMVHLACFWGWEHPWVAGMFLVFCDQQINGILRDGDFSDRVFRFRACDVGFARIVASGPVSYTHLHADETTLQVLKEPGRSSTSKSYMWLYRTSGCAKQTIVLYEYQPTRKAEHAEHFLQGFSGSVSYTHLDVYKRQHSTSSSATVFQQIIDNLKLKSLGDLILIF